MKCLNCGKEIAEDSNYCEYCGKATANILRTADLTNDIRRLPDDIRKFLSDDRFESAIDACRGRYGLSQEDASEFVNKMYLQSLVLRGKKLQALKHYCAANGICLKQGKDVIDMLEKQLKSNSL